MSEVVVIVQLLRIEKAISLPVSGLFPHYNILSNDVLIGCGDILFVLSHTHTKLA